MADLKGKRILFFQQRGWGATTGHMLAQRLQKEGAVLAALTLKRSTHAFTTTQQDVTYERIVNHDEIMSDAHAFLRGKDLSLADVCAGLGVDSVWPFTAAVRNFARSYGEKFYYGFTPNVSNEYFAAYIKALYLCAETFFETFKPDLIMAPNFVGLVHIVFNLYAKRHGIPMVALTDSKVRGIYMFCHDYKDTSDLLRARVQALDDGAASPNAGRAAAYVSAQRKAYMRPPGLKAADEQVPLLKRLRDELSPIRQIAAWYLHHPVNLLPNVGITLDYRPPRIILRDHFAKRSYKRFMDRFPYADFGGLKKFAYLPLQFQPEESIDVKAPFFNNQVETARLIAQAMPDDYELVVKDHPGMVGYRSPSFIRKIARLINVRVVDYRIPSDEILKRASLVIGQNSTPISEAAFYNRPAIQLGELATTLLMPHVTKHTDMTTLSAAIRAALKTDTRSEDYERRLRNYVAAAYDVGFEVDFGKLWEDGAFGPEETDHLWKIYRAEIARLLGV